jgi:hypothetical protein
MSAQRAERRQELPWVALCIVFAAVLVAAVWLRFGGQWAENDTVVLTDAARAVLREGTITPRSGAYDNGFGYPVLLATLSEMTGLSIPVLQTTVLPWFTVVTVFMAFAAFRAILGSPRAAVLSAMLLVIQPDFLFVNQRGSHEKITWTLVLAIIYALMSSLRERRLSTIAAYVAVFYLCGFALICTNTFFGSSFTTVILLALVGTVVLSRRLHRVFASKIVPRRLAYMFAALGTLVYLVMFYLYTPASSSISTLARVVDRLAALYLNVDVQVESNVASSTGVTSTAVVEQSATTVSPYTSVTVGWKSIEVFFALTAFTWLLVAASAIAWLVLGVTFARRGVSGREVPLFLVWIFAAAAAAQIGLSVGSDFAGVLGSNLQLRLFPVFILFAVPLLVATARWYRNPPRTGKSRWIVAMAGLIGSMLMAAAFPPLTALAFPLMLLVGLVYLNWKELAFMRRCAFAVAIVAFSYFTVAAVLKATNDPVVSNKWVFYTDDEAHALRWANKHLTDTFVWSEFDERLQMASWMLVDDRGDDAMAIWVTHQDLDSIRYVLISDVTIRHAERIGGVLPPTDNDDRIFDDGGTTIFHRVPQTPYQP